jgi:hypothetical protein
MLHLPYPSPFSCLVNRREVVAKRGLTIQQDVQTILLKERFKMTCYASFTLHSICFLDLFSKQCSVVVNED